MLNSFYFQRVHLILNFILMLTITSVLPVSFAVSSCVHVAPCWRQLDMFQPNLSSVQQLEGWSCLQRSDPQTQT